MCGIFGYIGNKQSANLIVDGLKKLEYRGYDSIGITTINETLHTIKKVGKVSELSKQLRDSNLTGTLGIGHTRWATHGSPLTCNAHPHLNKDKTIAIVHNGIIENYRELKETLLSKGYVFNSETDSEVIVHLIADYFQTTNDLAKSFTLAISQLEGAYAICMISSHDKKHIYATRKASPLLIGVGKNENFCASDVTPILTHTRDIIYLDEDDVAIISNKEINIFDLDGKTVKPKIIRSNINIEDVEKGNYEFYMKKEIHEQPESIIRTINNRCDATSGEIHFDNININNQGLLNINRIVITACGTSLHAGWVGEFFLEKFAFIPVEVEYAAEFRYRNPIIDSKTMVIAISQSGETADTLAAVKEAKQKGALVISICNVPGSTITRVSDGIIYTKAGVEIGVASTKAFTAQVTALYMFAIHMARIKWRITQEESATLIKELFELPSLIRQILGKEEIIFDLAEKYYKTNNFLYLGRGINFPVALEGALKMKEISYIHAEGYSAAEMKHGPIALIDENMPVIVIALKGRSYEKIISNIQEVKARQGIVIAIATEGDKEIKKIVDDVIYIPDAEEELSAILAVIPLQLLAYYCAVLRGCHVDQPRNLAKSVTVE